MKQNIYSKNNKCKICNKLISNNAKTCKKHSSAINNLSGVNPNIPTWNKGKTKYNDPRIMKGVRIGKDHHSYGKPSWSKGIKLTKVQRLKYESYWNSLKGKKLKPETVKKIIESRKGYTHSKETKQNISKANKGNPKLVGRTPWIKGKKHTVESLNKMSIARKGRYCGENNHFYGRKHTLETRKKISENNIGKCKGEKNHNWRGGTSFEPHTPDFNNKLKKQIRKRDQVCMLCFKGRMIKGKDSRALCVHHIDYDKTNSDPGNLISLHTSCHRETTFGDRTHWTKYFQETMATQTQRSQ